MKLAILAVLALSGGLVDAASAPSTTTVERTLYLMGTRVDLAVEANGGEAAVAGTEAALAALEQAEARLSTWSPTSELSRFNRSPAGAPFAASAELRQELLAAAACVGTTGGAFDPSVGALVGAWGLRTGGRRPTDRERRQAVEATGIDGVGFSDPSTLIRKRHDLTIEEGGFGKGAGLDRAAEGIATTPGVVSAVLDLGGQVLVWRDPGLPLEQPIEIAVADPEHRDLPVVAVAIDHGSLSTTGSSERAVTIDGHRYSHVLDPRTGLPAPDIGSVTVWAPTALLADCLSTGLYVLGPAAMERWAGAHPEIGVLWVEADASGSRRVAHWNGAFAGRLEPLAPDVELRRFADGEDARGDGARPAPLYEGAPTASTAGRERSRAVW